MKKFIVTSGPVLSGGENTLQCSNACFWLPVRFDITLHVIIVDDGSTDGTSDAIRVAFGDRVKLLLARSLSGAVMRLAMELCLL